MFNLSKWFLTLAAAGLAMAQVQPTFRVGTRLVQLDVVVLNDKTPVRGLTKEDFTVQDKGKTQEIAVFSVTEAHKAAKSNPLAANVASNRMNNRGESTSTATVILFDKMNTPSASQVVARKETLALLSSLKETDRVAFYSLDTDLSMVQDFTDGADRLALAAKALSASAPGAAAAAAGTPEDKALIASLQSALTAYQQGVDGSTRVASTIGAFRTIVRHLEGLPGRKNVIWLTASIPFTFGTSVERRQNDEAELDRMTRVMSEANVAVYTVDPRGAGGGVELTPQADTNSSGGRFLGGAAGRAADSAVNTLSGSQGLQKISEDTGGKAFYNTNDLAGAVREILDTTEITYSLGFYVDEKSLDGKNHDLSVKLAKKPETAKASVRHRKSYSALNAQALAVQQPRTQMAVLAADSLDASGIGMMAATAPNPNQPGTHLVQVRVDVADLTMERKGDKWTGSFDLGLAMQGSGRTQSSEVSVKTIPLTLSDDQLKQALAAGLVIDNTVPTPPQPMKLRVVIQDKLSGNSGSVRLPIGPK
jgi:VWFA-related protein